jgi:hypothetical protein
MGPREGHALARQRGVVAAQSRPRRQRRSPTGPHPQTSTRKEGGGAGPTRRTPTLIDKEGRRRSGSREGHAHSHRQRRKEERSPRGQRPLTSLMREGGGAHAREGGAPRGPRPRTSRSAAAGQRLRQGHANSHRQREEEEKLCARRFVFGVLSSQNGSIF